jgi:hypothetical protein
MIGHGALFIAAVVTSATAALGLPSSTAPEGCATRLALNGSSTPAVCGASHDQRVSDLADFVVPVAAYVRREPERHRREES